MSESWDIFGCIMNVRKKLGLLDIRINSQDDQSHNLKEDETESGKDASEQATKICKSDSIEEEEFSKSLPVAPQKKEQVLIRSNMRVTSAVAMSKDPVKEVYKSKNKFISRESKREGKISLINFIKENLRAKLIEPVINATNVIEEFKEIQRFGGDNKEATDCNFPVFQRHMSLSEISKDFDKRL